jgi:hypothetical protein
LQGNNPQPEIVSLQLLTVKFSYSAAISSVCTAGLFASAYSFGICPCTIILTDYNMVLHLALDFRGHLLLCIGCGAATDHGKASLNIPWDPGGGAWWRLEGKPPFKDGGMLASLLPADGPPDLAQAFLGSQLRRRHIYTSKTATGEGGLDVDGFGLHSLRSSSYSVVHPSSVMATSLPFNICYTEEEWEELKGKENKVEETGVSRSQGPESPAGPSSPESSAPKAGVSDPMHNNFAGKYNPHYVLLKDYYGDVYAKYVGPYDGFIEYAIWVPKILVTNKRGPIQKWRPKSKN